VAPGAGSMIALFLLYYVSAVLLKRLPGKDIYKMTYFISSGMLYLNSINTPCFCHVVLLFHDTKFKVAVSL